MSGASDALVLFLLLGLVVSNEGSNGGLTGAGRDYESVVMKLNDDSFSSAVNKAELMLVMFYAEWCHHCHNYFSVVLGPAAQQLQSQGVQFASLEIQESKKTQSIYEVNGVPDLKLFRKGQVFPYQGPAEAAGAEGLVKYLLEEKAKLGLEEDVVITLTTDNFDSITSSAELILVDFYADWCVHCQRLEPHFAAAARRLRYHDPPVLFGKVQVPDQLKVAERFGVEGYPLLLMFRHGRHYNYTGPRHEEGIVIHMMHQAGPPSITLSSTHDVEEFLSDMEEVKVVGYFSLESDPSLIEAFVESGNFVRGSMRLGHTTEGRVETQDDGGDTVVLYYPRHLVSRYESSSIALSSLPLNASALAESYVEVSRPLVGQMTPDNYDSTYRHRPLLVAYYDVNWDREEVKATQYWHDMIASVAQDYQDTGIVFAIAYDGDFSNDIRGLGLADWGEDVAVGLFAPGLLKYRMTDELSASSLREFVQSFMNGELESYFASEPPPRQTKGTLIKTIVGSTFKRIVLDPERNVMVRLCIPAIPECQQSVEWYNKVAKQFKGVKNLIFGDMNIALNDPPPGTQFDSLPVFYFSAKDSHFMDPVTPSPKDDADLAFFLKHKQSIKPLKKTGSTKQTKSKRADDEL